MYRTYYNRHFASMNVKPPSQALSLALALDLELRKVVNRKAT